ncbi:MAG: sodium:proton antiporter, partial [Proteobacteria bacterium]
MELHFLIYAISGALLLGIGLTSIYLEQSILTPSIIYLLFGVLLGPYALHLVSFDVSAHWAMIEYVTELVVIISVFSAGLKMKPLLGQRKWLSPFKLATIGVAIAVGLICFFGVTVLHLSLPVALLLGAILAPTDPVLASAVQVEHENDKDSLRFTLTAEAGMNDGSAFPFLFLALGLMGFHELGPGFSTWLGIDVAYGICGAILIGYGIAKLGAVAVNRVRGKGKKSTAILDEFFGLGLLGVVYGVCLLLGMYGFVGAFIAGVTFRRYEISATKPGEKDAQAATEEIITFNDNLEKVGEFVCIIALGAVLRIEYFTAQNLL